MNIVMHIFFALLLAGFAWLGYKAGQHCYEMGRKAGVSSVRCVCEENKNGNLNK